MLHSMTPISCVILLVLLLVDSDAIPLEVKHVEQVSNGKCVVG